MLWWTKCRLGKRFQTNYGFNACTGSEAATDLAETCLRWLEPDLIILDEFQRFKHLMVGESEDASEAAELAEHLFNFQLSKDDEATAARVLLLSATPYKMYTTNAESEQDDHYADFRLTLNFLIADSEKRVAFEACCRSTETNYFTWLIADSTT